MKDFLRKQDSSKQRLQEKIHRIYVAFFAVFEYDIVAENRVQFNKDRIIIL